MEERFFYHSFPRRRQNENEISKGLKILSSICNSGLLLTPEITKWKYEHLDNKPPRIEELLQRRICFTELAQSELSSHSDVFGHFAIEYDIVELKKIGAIPVFYVPLDMGKEMGAAIGSILLIQLLDLQNFLFTLQTVSDLKNSRDVVAKKLNLNRNWPQNPAMDKMFTIDSEEAFNLVEALNHGLTPLSTLTKTMDAILSFFYPADNLLHNKILDYYRQREWKICLNLNLPGFGEMFRKLNERDKKCLLDIDSTFFGKEMNFTYKKFNLIDECLVFDKFLEKHPLEFANRIIVPDEAAEDAKRILEESKLKVQIT